MTIKIKIILKKLLQGHDITAAQLARATKIPPQAINNWLSDQEPRNLNQIKVVADYFDIAVDFLIYGKEEKIVSINCRNAVRDSLHDPSNSEFDDYEHFYFKREKTNRFLVQVTGRAKNGFGALRKITVDCTVLKTDTGNYFVPNLKQIY
jgi:transcriptional regulator with XRE-family HTH domain